MDYPIWIGSAILESIRTRTDWLETDSAITRAQQDALDYIARHPDCSTGDVANAFGVKPGTMGTRLQRLQRIGRLRCRKEAAAGGRIARWVINETM